MLTFGPIETERLRLRCYRDGEAPLVHRLMGDARVMRFYPEVYDLERSQKVFDAIARLYQTLGYTMLAAERLSDGAFVGQIGLLHWDDVDDREDVEVAYMLLAEHWGMGYATEAARACRDWAFAHLPVDRVVSYIDVRNEPSIKVAERNGMDRLKRIDENRFGNPIYVYGIARDRWDAIVNPASEGRAADAGSTLRRAEPESERTGAEAD